MKAIPASQLQTLPRGRRSEFDPELLGVLKSIKPGHFGILDEEFGKVPVEKQSQTSAKIRKHWNQAVGEDTPVAVRWTPEGYAQVGRRADVPKK